VEQKKYFNANCGNDRWNIFVFIAKNVLLLIVTWLAANFLTLDIWKDNVSLVHTIFELLCVFISLSIFIIIWYTYDNNSQSIRCVGFAFLSVAIFTALHALFFPSLGFAPVDHKDLFTKFGIIGRLIEAICILTLIYNFSKVNVNKWVMLIVSLMGSFITSLILFNFPEFIPMILSDDGPTVYRAIIECVIFILFACCLPALVKEVNRRELLTYKYILSAIIFAIPVEILFSIYDSIYSFYNVWGHILKFISYCFLFKGIFISAVTYPYRTKVEQLNISEERFKNAFEYAAVGMAIVGLDGKWLKVNRFVCDITGYSHEELNNMTYKDIMHVDDLESDVNLTNQLLKGEIQYYHVERRYIHKDGYPIWVFLSCSLVRDNEGNPLYYVRQIQDITEVKKAYEAIEYDKLRSEFFANISHEFRTPLNIILNSIQLFDIYIKNDHDDDSRMIKHLNSMKQNCSRLIRLINNLIDMSRIDAGFYNLNKKEYNIVNVVEDITLSVADFIKSKGLQLEFNTNVQEKFMECDPDIIERIMLNLLSNAVKFTKNDGRINVNIYDDKDKIIISVKDNGIGIQKDKQELIFQRFRQVDKSLTRSHEGSGIGLSLVKSFVELHGGTIRVESEYGKGSEFIIVFPALEKEESCNNALDEAAATVDRLSDSRIETINVEFSDIYF